MMRILLGTGEEAVYRTVEELALGISSGVVTAAARFFDSPSQAWQSIETHPEYHQALARAALLVPASGYEPLPHTPTPTPERPERVSGSHRIYQMFSLSAAELQARRRPAWFLPAIAVMAGLAMLLSVVSLLWVRLRAPAARVERVTQLATIRPTDSPAGPSPTTVEAIRLAPVNLNSHQVYAMEAAGRRLGDTAVAYGLPGLLRESRLSSPDSVRQTRARLAAFRDQVSAYRASQRGTAAAYRDTAAMLTRTGFWSRVDQQEWKVFPSAAEPPAEAARADSLLGILQRLYDLLANQTGTYRSSSGRLMFRDSALRAEYGRLRAELSPFELAPDTSKGPPRSALGVLHQALRRPANASP